MTAALDNYRKNAVAAADSRMVIATPGGNGEPPELPVRVIRPRSGWTPVNFAEVWRSRDLLYHLTLRDILVRYKQTVLGIGWAVIQPLATMLVFSMFLGRMGGISAGIEHYALFVFAAVLPWTFFSNAINQAGLSLIQNQNLVTKIYFPRVLVPMAAIGAAVFDFLIGGVLLAGMMAWYGCLPSWTILWIPVCLAMLLVAATGIGMLFSALIVVQRDIRYVLGFAIQMWMFATPCIYLSADSLGPVAQTWLPLNPVYGSILNFRNAMLGLPMDLWALMVSSGVSLTLFLVGAVYFRRVEKSFADVI